MFRPNAEKSIDGTIQTENSVPQIRSSLWRNIKPFTYNYTYMYSQKERKGNVKKQPEKLNSLNS